MASIFATKRALCRKGENGIEKLKTLTLWFVVHVLIEYFQKVGQNKSRGK